MSAKKNLRQNTVDSVKEKVRRWNLNCQVGLHKDCPGRATYGKLTMECTCECHKWNKK